MIDFNEELKNFEPYTGIEEKDIYGDKLKDFTDVVKETVKDMIANQSKEK